MFDDIPLPSRKANQGLFNFDSEWKSMGLALTLAFFLGGIAAHRFYLGKWISALVINGLYLVSAVIYFLLVDDLNLDAGFDAISTGQLIGIVFATLPAITAGLWVFIDLLLLIYLFFRNLLD